MQPRLTRSGFTLIEILIALAILSLLLISVYEIMTNMIRSGSVTQWESVLTTEFNNADSRFRDFLNASSYPSLLTPQGNAVLKVQADGSPNPGFLLGFSADIGTEVVVENSGSAASGEQKFLSWYRCVEGRQGVESLADQPTKCTKINLVARFKGKTRANNQSLFDLYMDESDLGAFPTDFTAFMSTTAAPGAGAARSTKMVGDVHQIKTKLLPPQGTGTGTTTKKDRVQVELQIICVEPSQGNAVRSRTIAAEANVGSKTSVD